MPSSLHLDLLIILLVFVTWLINILVNCRAEFTDCCSASSIIFNNIYSIIDSFFSALEFPNSYSIFEFDVLPIPLLLAPFSFLDATCFNSAANLPHVAHQYISRCCMTHAVRTISETIHQRDDEPLPIPATRLCCLLLSIHVQSRRQDLIGPINQ